MTVSRILSMELQPSDPTGRWFVQSRGKNIRMISARGAQISLDLGKQQLRIVVADDKTHGSVLPGVFNGFPYSLEELRMRRGYGGHLVRVTFFVIWWGRRLVRRFDEIRCALKTKSTGMSP